MLVFGLRLLVALITFAAGLASAALLGSTRAPLAQGQYVTTERVVVLQGPEASGTTEVRGKYGCNLTLDRRVVEGGILNAKAVSKPEPRYPDEARDARVEGNVPVLVVVDEGGDVSSAVAVGGPPMLRLAAVEAARRARFAPTKLSGRAVRVGGVITYDFVLR